MPSSSIFYCRDQQNREVGFLWVAAGKITAMEAKWKEHPENRDGDVMKSVAGLFAERAEQPYRINRRLIICRTPESFPLRSNLVAVNGFRLHDAWSRSDELVCAVNGLTLLNESGTRRSGMIAS